MSWFIYECTYGFHTTTPFWIQVFRLPFLSKSETLARFIGNLIGTFFDVHEDSLSEGWGPFLRIRVAIDLSKPLLRGQLVTFPWIADELWLEYRYERLLDFCYDCGIIGYVFDKCPSFLEKIDEGNDPHLTYGPWMEDSALPNSCYNQYMQDFSKAGPCLFITRLVRNTITPIIPHIRQPPTLPSSISNREKGKGIVDYLNLLIDPHETKHSSSRSKEFFDVVSNISSTLVNSIALLVATPPAYLHVPCSLQPNTSILQPQVENVNSTYVTTNRVNSKLDSIPLSFNVASITAKENKISALFSKRKLVSSGGNVRNVLKRCRTKAPPLPDSTNFSLYQQPDPSSELSHLSLGVEGSDASLGMADILPRQSS
uniref:Zinc knuckle CX2CX4HX4C domain-containing protein n=1 Tax=Cannabis sativa TaxID=3483 RepID=A0A803Q743_CANSA